MMGASVVFGVTAYLVGRNQLDSRGGTIMGVSVFVFFFVIGAYLFWRVENWTWLPLILGVGYVIVPEFILGPADDLLAVVLGAVITGVLNYRKQKRKKIEAVE